MNAELSRRLTQVKQKLFDIYYANLNEMQRKAVYTVNGHLLVIAGAGSGKTTVLVQRISQIILYGNAYYGSNGIEATENDIAGLEAIAENAAMLDRNTLKDVLSTFAVRSAEPYRILSITFTNKAAGEMKARLAAELGDKANEIWAGTFHSVCVRLLRQFIDRIGYKRDFTIYDQSDSKKLIGDIAKELKIDDKAFSAKKIMNVISRQKNKLITAQKYELTADEPYEKEVYAKVYTEYQKRLKSSNAVDFDDIIMLTVELLQQYDEVREYCQNRFSYVFVDEYQDTNYAQFMLLDIISEKCGNLMVVGDDDQSIYKFRGATIENILNFDKYYKDSQVILLEQNYRSTKNILGAANAVISHNTDRKGKLLWCDRDKGELITSKTLEDAQAEAVYVAEEIESLVINKKANYKDIAILYRSNVQAQIFERVFAQSGLPHRILGGIRFFERREIQDIIAYLCVINNPSDAVRLTRIINQPKRGIGQTTVSRIASLAAENDTDMFSVIKNAREYPDLARSAEKLSKFSKLIDELRDDANTMSLHELFSAVIQKTEYTKMLQDECDKKELEDRADNLDELISTAISYEENHDQPTLSGYLDECALISDIDNYDETSDAVVLMTIHSAKGLEFDYVFLVGMEENIFPSSMSQATEEELSEERRLAYVAITRAKKKLYVTRAKCRLLYGNYSYNPASRFIKDIPEQYVEGDTDFDSSDVNTFDRDYEYGYSDPSRYSFDFQKKRRSYANGAAGFSAAPPKKEKQAQPKRIFNTGDRVQHIIFGDGEIVSAKPMAQDVLYEINFEKVGIKKLMGNYAKLKPAEE
ncbi:MAG: 3'-5' exonuclease [Firmicutes bacterium]|nr:3'-5' exonuclease [Bacillota bacterium]